jgi:hypothetical protein
MDVEKEFLEILEKVNTNWNSKLVALNDVKVLLALTPKVKAINAAESILTKQLTICNEEVQKTHSALWNHKGRNYVTTDEVNQLIAPSKPSVVDYKLGRLQVDYDIASSKRTCVLGERQVIQSEYNKIFVPYRTRVIELYNDLVKVNTLTSMVLPVVNVEPVSITRDFKSIDKLIKRLENGKYRDKNAMLVKIIKTYSRTTGNNNAVNIIIILKEKYPIMKKELEKSSTK